MTNTAKLLQSHRLSGLKHFVGSDYSTFERM